MKTKRILGLVFLIVVGVLVYYSWSSPLLLSPQQAREKIIQGAKVLDVRSDLEYNLGHYPEAIHIPVGDLAKTVKTVLPSKETPIVVYCNTGQRSRYAAEMLNALGYKNTGYIAGPYWSLLR